MSELTRSYVYGLLVAKLPLMSEKYQNIDSIHIDQYDASSTNAGLFVILNDSFRVYT